MNHLVLLLISVLYGVNALAGAAALSDSESKVLTNEELASKELPGVGSWDTLNDQQKELKEQIYTRLLPCQRRFVDQYDTPSTTIPANWAIKSRPRGALKYEMHLALQDPLNSIQIFQVRDMAMRGAEESCEEYRDGFEPNAVVHFLTNMIMTRMKGREFACKMGSAHEALFAGEDFDDLESGTITLSKPRLPWRPGGKGRNGWTMDMINNAAGILAAERFPVMSSKCIQHLRLVNRVATQMRAGEEKYKTPATDQKFHNKVKRSRHYDPSACLKLYQRAKRELPGPSQITYIGKGVIGPKCNKVNLETAAKIHYPDNRSITRKIYKKAKQLIKETKAYPKKEVRRVFKKIGIPVADEGHR